MMDSQPLTIHSWPQAILHVDADAFFASCEQAIHPELRGRPVITGKERGIVSAASYEAKARGVKRAMRLFEVRKVCKDAVILPSDYETYSLFSMRMFEICRRFSPDVEEYSIDEAFIDLTGLRRSFHGSYGMIAENIQMAIEKELGITVSIGVSLSKVLAKIGSKHNKPHGCTIIPGRDIHLYLENLPVEKVWGIGANTAAFLKKLGITTALQFAGKDEIFIKKYLSKPYQEIWHELNGVDAYYEMHTINHTGGILALDVHALDSSNGFQTYGTIDDPYLTLYSSSFNPASECTNYIQADDDEGIDNDSVMFLDLPAGTYIAVVSGYDAEEIGSYELSYTSFQAASIPTMNEWGMIIFAALAGSASIYLALS